MQRKRVTESLRKRMRNIIELKFQMKNSDGKNDRKKSLASGIFCHSVMQLLLRQAYGPSHRATRFIWLMMWPISLEPRVGISLSFSPFSLPSPFCDHSKLLLSCHCPVVASQWEIIETEPFLSSRKKKELKNLKISATS